MKTTTAQGSPKSDFDQLAAALARMLHEVWQQRVAAQNVNEGPVMRETPPVTSRRPVA